MIYLTYNDSPSGIFSSQAVDVCRFLNKKFDAKVRLVSIISIRDFSQNKRKIKSEIPDAIVLPMFPKLKNWKWNFYTLIVFFSFLNTNKIIARGPFAASLALSLKKIGIIKWVCFDSRGASAAEMNEYNVTDNKKIKKNIFLIEKNAVTHSDFRMAVSHELVKYWRDAFEYNIEKHVVIPCTLNSHIFKNYPPPSFINKNRNEMGFSNEDIVLAYSGSSAGWQSLKLLDEFLHAQMKQNKKIKVILLLKSLPANMKIMEEYKNRIVCKWLNEDKVPVILSCCDYGILIREKSVTNKVSSPVKFAEYLACGLKIIISGEIGDYSEFVTRHECGFVLSNPNQPLQLNPIPLAEKQKLSLLAINNFSKEVNADRYQKIIK